jgi:hypothetical protein
MAHTYPIKADINTAFAQLTDPDIINARNLAICELESTCEVDKKGDKTVLRITRRIKRDNVPKALSKVFKPVQTVNFVEEWWRQGDEMVGHYHSDIIGMPVTVDADLKLSTTKTGCEYYIDHAPKANIPLVGRLVEKFIISQSKAGVGAEIDYMNTKLS